MYLQKKSSKRKTFAPINARKRKKLRIKRFFLAFTICLFLFLCFWSLKKGFEYIFEHKNQWFTWKAKAFVIEAEDDFTKEQIKDLLSFRENTLISGEDAKNLQNTLQTKLNQIQKVQVKRGFFSKKLYIKTKNYEVLSKLQNKDNSYLLSTTGVLFNYDRAAIPPQVLQLKTDEEIKSEFLPQELVKLLKDVSQSSLKDIAYVEVSLKKETFKLIFTDGTVVSMGSFDAYNDKILALKDIIDISQKKGIKGPYNINFNYFNKGKIYLNKQV